MAVLEFVLEFALLAETAAMIQIALEDVPGINLEKIERDGLFRLFRGGDGGAFRIRLRCQPNFDERRRERSIRRSGKGSFPLQSWVVLAQSQSLIRSYAIKDRKW